MRRQREITLERGGDVRPRLPHRLRHQVLALLGRQGRPLQDQGPGVRDRLVVRRRLRHRRSRRHRRARPHLRRLRSRHHRDGRDDGGLHGLRRDRVRRRQGRDRCARAASSTSGAPGKVLGDGAEATGNKFGVTRIPVVKHQALPGVRPACRSGYRRDVRDLDAWERTTPPATRSRPTSSRSAATSIR